MLVLPWQVHLYPLGISHYAGSSTYNAIDFIDNDCDLLDSAFVSFLWDLTDGFVAKSLAGPSPAAAKHSMDENSIVQAQVSSRPLRESLPVCPRITHSLLPVTNILASTQTKLTQ